MRRQATWIRTRVFHCKRSVSERFRQCNFELQLQFRSIYNLGVKSVFLNVNKQTQISIYRWIESFLHCISICWQWKSCIRSKVAELGLLRKLKHFDLRNENWWFKVYVCMQDDPDSFCHRECQNQNSNTDFWLEGIKLKSASESPEQFLIIFH